MCLCACDIPPSCWSTCTACNIQFPECRRLTLFNCVMILQGLCPYDIDMSCQDFCTVCLLRNFPTITPSVSSMWFLLSSTCMLHFVVFLFFCDDFTNWEYYCESAIIFCGPQTPPVPLNVHYLYMSCGASTKTIYVFWRLWSMGFKLLEKHNFFPFLIHLYSSTRDAEPGKAYSWRGAPVPCVCWYMYLQTSSQENIVSRVKTSYLADECLLRLSLASPS